MGIRRSWNGGLSQAAGGELRVVTVVFDVSALPFDCGPTLLRSGCLSGKSMRSGVPHGHGMRSLQESQLEAGRLLPKHHCSGL
jgi:hypothetical protein